MNREEIQKHLNELSDSEISYREHPEKILNEFYLALDQMGLKDENGVYLFPESLIRNQSQYTHSTHHGFWDILEKSEHQNDFVLKKATRFYREPFMKADFIVIRYVYAGECIIYTPNKKIVLHENDAIMIDAGFIISQELKHEEDTVFSFLFTKEFILNLLKQGPPISNEITRFFFDYVNQNSQQNCQIYHGDRNRLIKDAIEGMICEYLDPVNEGGKALLESYLNIFLIQLSTCEAEIENEYKEDISRIAGMLNYINLNYIDVDLNTLADLYGYNPKYISRLFKKITGVNLKDYIYKKTLDSFCSYLLNSDMPIQEILADLNISSEAFFFNRLKEVYSVSPAQYRKQKMITGS